MCGINAIIGPEQDTLEDRLRDMNSRLQHRGPDGTGVMPVAQGVIGHTRLAIVDHTNEAATGPLRYENLILSFNGEIYNHDELREELEKSGYQFTTACDTEVVLKALHKWGKEALSRFDGQFAILLHDEARGETLLARDPTGMKPIYWRIDNQELVVSSHPANTQTAFVPDLGAVASMLTHGSVFAAGEEPLGSSLYQGVESPRPGEAVIIREGGVEREKFYSLPITDIDNPLSEQEAVDNLREVVTSAIKKRIPAEVKLGIALSGGLDSSIVGAIAADNYDGEIIASCIRFTADSNNPDYEHAQVLAASRENIKLFTADLSPENFLDDLEEMVAVLGPHDSIRQLGMFANYKVLKERGVKVVLTGEGSDEFNWGYWHRFPGLRQDREACATSESFRELVLARREQIEELFTEEKRALIDFDKGADDLIELYESFTTTDSTRKMMGVYGTMFNYFLLKANDGCGMAHSIEPRCAFQDEEVIETCTQIPRSYQVTEEPENEKIILREAFRDVLPETIADRRKAPLPAAAHIDYHRAISNAYQERLRTVDSSFWESFNKEMFETIGENYETRIASLEARVGEEFTAEEAGAALMEWRPVSEQGSIYSVEHIRTNDVFKLLTMMVWYDQQLR